MQRFFYGFVTCALFPGVLVNKDWLMDSIARLSGSIMVKWGIKNASKEEEESLTTYKGEILKSNKSSKLIRETAFEQQRLEMNNAVSLSGQMARLIYLEHNPKQVYKEMHKSTYGQIQTPPGLKFGKDHMLACCIWFQEDSTSVYTLNEKEIE